MDAQGPSLSLLRFIVDYINVGLLVIDREYRIVLWNRYLEAHSGRKQAELLGQNLFSFFPELDRSWLEKKLKSVLILKNFAFTSWQQRPYLFNFKHHRTVTGGAEHMSQDCTFLPVPDESGTIAHVCIVIADATDTSIYQAKLNQALVQIAEQSVRDALTGLYNRRKLEDDLASEFKRAKRYATPASLLIFDIDYFKRVNDSFGHLTGDDVIRHVGKVAEKELRDTDIVGRYGGEEFAAILPGVALDGALAAAERIRRAVANNVIVSHGREVPVTISIGVAEFRASMPALDAWVQEADAALYGSKRAGRNRVTALIISNDSDASSGESPQRELPVASLRVIPPR